MTLAILTTLATVLAGIVAVMLVPFLARRGGTLRALAYGIIGAVFAFSFSRWIAGLAGAALFGLPRSDAELLTGGLPLRSLDLMIFAVFLAIGVAVTLSLRRRRRRA
ncbi:hypothetical protein [Oceaniglobus roseus]|uniref:hypothetical protein n=1 Tax=Oceaniglobus roseus TaxID=1737570 RepID=UPI000C7E87BD|nr:hypothetical protein [Kandeliimicrobium roseum]